MATSTDTTEERQLDEFGEPIPTQEEMDAEARKREQERLDNLAKTQQAMALAEAAKREEAQLPSQLPQGPGSTPPVQPGGAPGYEFGRGIGVLQPPPTSALSNSTGRMYMGPNVSDAMLQAMVPQGRSFSALAPPTPEAAAGAGARVQALTAPEPNSAVLARMQANDRPGNRTIGVANVPMPPPSDAEAKFEAQQGYLGDIQRGMSQSEAARKWMPIMFGGQRNTGMMTEYQALNARMRQQQLDQQNQIANARLKVVAGKPSMSPAVVNAHKALIAAELQAKLNGDARAMNDARLERTKFEQQHPELGLTPAAAEPTTTATTPAARTVAPVAPTVAPRPGSMPNVATQAQYDALPSGTIYLSPDGKKRRKP